MPVTFFGPQFVDEFVELTDGEATPEDVQRIKTGQDVENLIKRFGVDKRQAGSLFFLVQVNLDDNGPNRMQYDSKLEISSPVIFGPTGQQQTFH